jgi:hypothetical protein
MSDSPQRTHEVGECGRTARAEPHAESGSPSYADTTVTVPITQRDREWAMKLGANLSWCWFLPRSNRRNIELIAAVIASARDDGMRQAEGRYDVQT